MKKILVLVLSAALLIGLLAGCGQDPAGTEVPTTTAPAATEGATGPVLLCNNIQQFMETQGFPKCYGGCYLDTETFCAVILATDIKEVKSLLKATLEGWDKEDYRFVEASVSYQKLLEAEQKVQDAIDIWTAMDVQIASITIDVRNSCVSVGVVDLNSANSKAVRELVNDPMVNYYNVPSSSLEE